MLTPRALRERVGRGEVSEKGSESGKGTESLITMGGSLSRGLEDNTGGSS